MLVYNKKALFFTTSVGECTDPKTGAAVADIAHTLDGKMLVKSSDTKKSFVFTWQDAIDLARAVGTFEPGPDDAEHEEVSLEAACRAYLHSLETEKGADRG